MKIAIGDSEYSVSDALGKATLRDLYELKTKTGIGMKTLKESLDRMSELDDPEDFLEDAGILQGLGALIWLCRRRAGENLTVDEATDVELGAVRFVVDVAEAADDADPTEALTVSDQG